MVTLSIHAVQHGSSLDQPNAVTIVTDVEAKWSQSVHSRNSFYHMNIKYSAPTIILDFHRVNKIERYSK